MPSKPTQSTPFELEGFLCPISTLVDNPEFAHRCGEWPQLYRDVNQLAMLVFYSAKADGATRQRVFANAMFVRLLTNYQCIFRLTEMGLGAECRAIMRSMLEALVVLGATEKVPDFHERFYRHSQNEHRRMLQKLKELDLLCEEDTADLDGLLQFSKRDALPWTAIAEAADLSEFFKMQYARLCKHAHPDFMGLLDGFRFNDSGQPVGTLLKADFVDADHNLMTTIGFMTMAMGSMNRLFRLGYIDGLAKMLVRHGDLMNGLMSSAED